MLGAFITFSLFILFIVFLGYHTCNTKIVVLVTKYFCYVIIFALVIGLLVLFTKVPEFFYLVGGAIFVYIIIAIIIAIH